jgi:flagellar basal-body rod protein FlgC
MPSFGLFQIAGSGLAAQSARLNTVSSNLANADVVATRPEDAYKARIPIFQSQSAEAGGGVNVVEIKQSEEAPEKRYQPGHPLADEGGYVYAPNVNPVEEMANMISAARSYQSNLEVVNTAKTLMLHTLNLGR